MQRLRCFLTLVVILLCYSGGHHCAAQTALIDALKQKLSTATLPIDRLSVALQLCEQRESLASDSLYHYAVLAKALSASLKDSEKEGLADYYIGVSQQRNGSHDSAIRLAESYLQKLSLDDYVLRQNFSYLKATSLVRSSQYQDAIAISYDILHLAEEHGDTLMQVVAHNTIGWACMEMNSYSQAVPNLQKAIGLGQHGEQYQKAFGIACSNIAAVYNSLGRYDSASYYINKAIIAARQTQSLNKLANALNIQADGYILTGNDAMAEKSLKEALATRQSIGDPYYIVSDMYQLALFYAHSGQAAEGIQLSEKGIALARQYGLTSKLPILYEALAECHKANGNLTAYGKTLEQLIAIKDSVYQSNTAEALAGLKAQYEVEKQENIIIRQKLAIIRQNYLFYAALFLLLVAVVASIVLFQGYRRKQRLRLGQMIQEEKRIAATAVREAEEAERKRIAADLHDNLGAYAASIASNIDHIHATANSMRVVALQDLRSNAREMVSQLHDTIWVLKRDALSLTAISDRVKPFVQRLSASHPELKLDVEENITDDKVLSPVQAFHLFRMIQEAVANAVKHSGGTRILTFIKSTSADFSIHIQDNGKGMGAASSRHDGNGLYNMKARAEAGGWIIQWMPIDPSGTRVVISPATTN